MLDFDIGVDLSDVGPKKILDDKPTRILLTKAENTENDYVLQIDNTSLEKFTTCERSAEYYLVRQRELARSSAALTFGSAIHKALEVQLVYGNGPQSATRQNEVILEWFNSAGGYDPEDYRTPDRAIQVMERYRKKFPSDIFEVIAAPNGDPYVEVKFTVPLGVIAVNAEVNYPHGTKTYIKDLHIVWTGKIDALIEMDGWIWVLDHKTTSIAGKGYFQDFVLNNAQHGYVWAARQLMNKPVRGSFLNAIINRPPTKTGTSIEFHRQQFPYSESQLDEWHDNTLFLISDFISHLRRGYFPRETKQCIGKYGACPYHDVCTLDKSNRDEQLASSMYKNVVWNPLDND